jgi:hypothetical protein
MMTPRQRKARRSKGIAGWRLRLPGLILEAMSVASAKLMAYSDTLEHKVNGMTTRVVCSPLTPALSLQGEGVIRAAIILW